MIRRRNNPEATTEALVGAIWVGTFLAVILAVPPLGIFLGIYLTTGEIVAGAVLGFGAHFAVLAFSPRISDALSRMVLGR